MADLNFNFLNSPDYGVLGGQRAQADLANKASEIQGRQSEMQLHQLQGEEAKQKIEMNQRSMEEEARFAQAMKGGGGVQAGGSYSDQLSALAKTAFDSGSFTKGMKFSELAQTALGHENEQQARLATAAHAQAEAHKVAIEQVAGVAQQIKTLPPALQQSRYEAMLGQLAQDPSMKSVVAGMPKLYSDAAPRLDVMIGEATKALTQITEMRQALDEQRRDARESAYEKHMSVMEAATAAREHLAEQREARLEKNGGKAIGAPSSSEITLASQAVLEHILPTVKRPAKGEALDEDASRVWSQIDAGARDVAMQAKEISTQRKIPYQTALAQVVSEQKAGGDWALTQKATTLLGFKTGEKTSGVDYKGGGKTPDTAIIAPEPSSRNVGHYYLVNGKTYQWIKEGGKTGWKEVANVAAQ